MTKRYTPLRLIDPTCYMEGTTMREAAGGRMRLDRLGGSSNRAMTVLTCLAVFVYEETVDQVRSSPWTFTGVDVVGPLLRPFLSSYPFII
jgi:hypothetical protein